MTIQTAIGCAAITLYLISSYGLVLGWRNARGGTLSPMRLAWLATVLHVYSIQQSLLVEQQIDFSFLNMAAVVAALIVLIVLLVSLRHPADKLGALLFPLAAGLLGLRSAWPQAPHVLHETALPMQLHILASILAYSVLNVAAVQAVLAALQDWQLRKKQPLRLLNALPPLQTMETFLFRLIWAGMALLSVSLLTGLAYVDDLFAQHLAHKTVLSILAWWVFALLLWGRAAYGWRGRTAMRWTLSGFGFLMLAYFGSKVVLELILHRV